MSWLPSYGVLQSCLTGNYMDLSWDVDGPTRGYIRFTGDSVLSPCAKIAFEKSEIAPDCVHIRCCYNNKYWTRSSPESGSPIVAGAKEAKPKEENQDTDGGNQVEGDGDCSLVKGRERESSWEWDCTLFKVEQHPNGIVSIRHVGTGDVLCVKGGGGGGGGGPKDEGELLGDPPSRSDSPEEAGCLVGVKSTILCPTEMALTSEEAPTFAATYLPTYFKLIDSRSVVVLPRFVAFKGDNNSFLQVHRHAFLQFSSRDPRAPTCQMEVFQYRDGTVRVKSVVHNSFWRRYTNQHNWISPISGGSNDLNTLFEPVRVDSNKVALRNLGNNRFCSRFTDKGETSCLNADSTTARFEATLEVHELVLSREIYNVRYRLGDAKIYDQRPLVMRTASTANATSQTSSYTFRFTYKVTTIKQWNASVSAGLSAKATFRAGIPVLASGRLTISAEISGTYEWGETTEVTTEDEKISHVTVPPMTRVTAKLIASTGKYDVPFSYTQRDVLIDGREVIYDEDDGLYSGGNTYNVDVELTEEPIKN